MKIMKKTMQLFASAILLTMAGQAQAQIQSQMQYQAETQYYDYAQPSDSCFPAKWCVNKEFIRADLLFLWAFEDGLSNPFEPFSSQNFSNCENYVIITGKGKQPDFKWDVGFRIGSGLDFTDCTWRLAAFWTHFWPGHTKDKCEKPSWKLEYDTLDVVVGYKCKFNSCFTLDAFGGLRFAQINQHIRGNFRDATHYSHSSSSDLLTYQHKKVSQDFEGAGCLFGIIGEFDAGCGFTFFLEGDTGTLAGRNRIRYYNESSHGNFNSVLRYKRHQDAVQYFVDGSIGVRWETDLFKCSHLNLELAFEGHNYLNHNRMNTEGSLCLSGGRFAASLQF